MQIRVISGAKNCLWSNSLPNRERDAPLQMETDVLLLHGKGEGAQNNPHAKVTCFGVMYFSLLHTQEHEPVALFIWYWHTDTPSLPISLTKV